MTVVLGKWSRTSAQDDLVLWSASQHPDDNQQGTGLTASALGRPRRDRGIVDGIVACRVDHRGGCPSPGYSDASRYHASRPRPREPSAERRWLEGCLGSPRGYGAPRTAVGGMPPEDVTAGAAAPGPEFDLAGGQNVMTGPDPWRSN